MLMMILFIRKLMVLNIPMAFVDSDLIVSCKNISFINNIIFLIITLQNKKNSYFLNNGFDLKNL